MSDKFILEDIEEKLKHCLYATNTKREINELLSFVEEYRERMERKDHSPLRELRDKKNKAIRALSGEVEALFAERDSLMSALTQKDILIRRQRDLLLAVQLRATEESCEGGIASEDQADSNSYEDGILAGRLEYAQQDIKILKNWHFDDE
jgi:hypothetical protein